MTNRRYRYKGEVDEVRCSKNQPKSKVRTKVEPAFLVIKCLFGLAKTRHKGLEESLCRLFVTCAVVNLYLVRRRLLHLA